MRTGSRRRSGRSKRGSGGGGRKVVFVGDGDVGLAAEDGGQGFLRLHLGQVELDVRGGAGQRGPGGGHEGGGGGREGRQRDPAGDLVAQRRQVGLGRVQAGQQGVGVGDED